MKQRIIMEKCFEEISKDIQMSCSSPMVAGYTGRGLIFPRGTFAAVDYQGPSSDAHEVLIDPVVGATFWGIDNVFVDPFTGTSKQSTGESGRIEFQKTVQVRIPMRGGAVSRDIVEAMHHSEGGYMLVLEKKNNEVDGKYEVIGLMNPAKPTADGTTQNESENGGDIVMILQTTENYFEVTFVGQVQMAADIDELTDLFDSFYAMAGAPVPEPGEDVGGGE